MFFEPKYVVVKKDGGSEQFIRIGQPDEWVNTLSEAEDFQDQTSADAYKTQHYPNDETVTAESRALGKM